MKIYLNQYVRLFILVLILHVKFIYCTIKECNANIQSNCCLISRSSRFGPNYNEKTNCKHYSPSNSQSGTNISTNNAFDLEYYRIRTYKSKHIMRVRWVNFKLSGSMPECLEDSVYVQIG